MTVSLASLTKLMSLRLSTEQMEGVIAVLAEELKPLEAIRAANASRQRHKRASRDCHVTADADSNAMPRDTRVIDITSTSKQESKKEEVLTLRVEPEGFQEFWAIYPKRLGDASRKQAVRAFSPALKRCDLKTILLGARRYADHCKVTGKTNTEFVKQARTWLNADGWTETYESASSNDFSSARLLLERIGRA